MKYNKIAGMAGILAPIVFIVAVVLAIGTHDWFSWTKHALSDTGAVGVPYNYIINYGGILTAILGVLFAAGLWSGRGSVGLVGPFLYAFGMFFLALLGLFPIGGARQGMHDIAAVLFFILTMVGIFFVGLSEYRAGRKYGPFFLGLFSVGLLGGLCAKVAFEGGFISQIVIIVCTSIFFIVYGVRLYSSRLC